MLIDFFYTLRAAKLPVSVKEYLTLPEAEKARLRTMTPGNYIGKAVALAQRIGK